MSRNQSTGDILRPLADTPQQAYLSRSVQVADILRWILDQTGPADVRMTSFSISEEFLRRIFFIRKENLVRSLDIVLDFKATNKTLLLWPFIAQTVRHCYLADNHSKILLVSNENWKVAVIMSQNLTRGNRYESGIISTCPDMFESLSSQLHQLITRQSVPFHEIFARTTGKH
ncbi:C4-dicarboxylate ABC transporter [uncultured Duncaniella sp.]|uniref:C4-dicarboxylate ABC transporter n=1 Tax=uncultured Duncaniella sp. TaxID=2768039 RepID=UPI002639795F|nr:C4-dicarboxylate ABC transporter [uncultured Duncaniella sp.]